MHYSVIWWYWTVYIYFKVPAGYSVKEVMDTWTLQMGLPYINITFDNSGPKTLVTATQKRFLADKNIKYDENESPFRFKCAKFVCLYFIMYMYYLFKSLKDVIKSSILLWRLTCFINVISRCVFCYVMIILIFINIFNLLYP